MTRAEQPQQPGDGWPDFLIVEQAAAILRIGRTAAYALAGRYIATDGKEGMPAIRVGKQLRVPRTALERWLGGPLTPPVIRPALTPVALARSSERRSYRASRSGQSSLPFGA
jgi:excisionase family DNA binding protein